MNNQQLAQFAQDLSQRFQKICDRLDDKASDYVGASYVTPDEAEAERLRAVSDVFSEISEIIKEEMFKDE